MHRGTASFGIKTLHLLDAIFLAVIWRKKDPEFVQSFPEFSLSFPEFSPKKWISVFHWFSLVFWPSSIQVEFVLKQDWKKLFLTAWWLPDDCLATATELSKPGQEIFLTAWQNYNCLTSVLWLPDDCQTTAWFDHKKIRVSQSFPEFQSPSQSFPEFPRLFPKKMNIHISLVLIGSSSIQVEFVLNFEWKRAFFWLPDNCLTTARKLPDNCLTTATELSKPGQEIFFDCLTKL